jgi:hypothetical protein
MISFFGYARSSRADRFYGPAALGKKDVVGKDIGRYADG